MVNFQEMFPNLFDKGASGSILFFDTETNGLTPTNSVLSINALKYSFTVDETIHLDFIDSFERFYFSKEPENEIAINCNGLTKEKIEEHRVGFSYPNYQVDDTAFEMFCEDVSLFVAHNISFDRRFFKFMENKPQFCTMRSNTQEVKAPFPSGKSGYKTPTLAEAAKYYDIAFNETEAHSSVYDTNICYQIFIKMISTFKSA